MKYTSKEIGFILYNNRSINLVNKFIPNNWDGKLLIDLEDKFDWVKSKYAYLENMVEVGLTDLNIECDDIIFTREDIKSCEDDIKNSIGKFSESELNFLKNRNIDPNLLIGSNIGGLSNITNKKTLEIIGAKCHPILSNILEDGIDEGGIIFPLFNNDGEFINCAIRRISDVGKLKYTLSIPDIPVWGLDDIKGDEVWLTEGLFDMYTLRKEGVKSCSVSSAMWSGLQLYQLVKAEPSKIIIWVDNDRVGLKVGLTLQRFFNMIGIKTITVHSTIAKDAAEHFTERGGTWEDVKEIKITPELVGSNIDQSFNFLKYLKKREF